MWYAIHYISWSLWRTKGILRDYQRCIEADEDTDEATPLLVKFVASLLGEKNENYIAMLSAFIQLLDVIANGYV